MYECRNINNVTVSGNYISNHIRDGAPNNARGVAGTIILAGNIGIITVIIKLSVSTWRIFEESVDQQAFGIKLGHRI